MWEPVWGPARGPEEHQGIRPSGPAWEPVCLVQGHEPKPPALAWVLAQDLGAGADRDLRVRLRLFEAASVGAAIFSTLQACSNSQEELEHGKKSSGESWRTQWTGDRSVATHLMSIFPEPWNYRLTR